MSAHILELGKRIVAAAKAASAALQDKSVLIISNADRPRSFAELDDRALAAFSRRHLIACGRACGKLATERKMTSSVAMSMFGSLALYRICSDANAAAMTIDHAGVTWNGAEQGDWRIIISRVSYTEEGEV